MSRPRRILLAATALTLLATASSAAADSYVSLRGAPGYGPSRYAKVYVEKVGPRSAKHVLVLIPGTFAGAGSFDLVAHELVKRVKGLQVWSIDRRPNQLEDTSAMVRALRGTVTSRQAFDYYLGWIGDPSVSPRYRPLDDADYTFARRWGLKLAMEDTRRVVRAARRGGRTVILGGHSLGASSALAYATWDFHGHAGYRDIAGLVLIDGGGASTGSSTLAEAEQSIRDLQDSSPWLDLLGIGLPWAAGVLEETGAIGALREPNAASVGQASPLLPAEFKPPVPVTNRAQFGYAFDYRTSPAALALIHVHSGHVAPQAGPDGLHGWVDSGVTPVASLARIAAHEPGNFAEWYYPKRLTIDVRGASGYTRTKVTDFLGLRTWHRRGVNVPLYAFQTDLSNGRVLKAAKAFVHASRVRRATYVNAIKGYSHLDPLAAAPKRNAFLRTAARFLRRIVR